jgi:hypothetical protein
VRPLALALGCGVCYGVAAFAIKLVTSDFDHGLAGLFSNWPIYILLVVGPVGYLLNQNAFQQGTFLAPVQAIITAADPVLSVALGIVWLDVRVRSSPAAIAGEVASLVVMVIGIVITSESSPQVTAAAEAAQTDQRPTPSNPLRQPTRPVQQFVAEPRGGRRQVGDRQPDVVQPGRRERPGQPCTFSPSGSQVRYDANRPDGSRCARTAASRR